jgi:choline-sulfatase
MTTRRDFLKQTGTALVIAGCRTVPRSSRARANVLLLMSDEHNPRYASVYGHSTIKTPNLDRLARMGTVFDHAYCPSPLCMPCRSAFMAGHPVHALQTYSNCNAVEFDYPTYGAVLRGQGVHTAYIGKTDVYRPSGELGFSEMILPGDRAKPGDTKFRRQPLAIRDDAAARASAYGPVKDTPFARDDRIIDAALEWLGARSKQIPGPWVLAVNLSKPHFPHYVTQDFWDLYPDGGDLPKYGTEAASANHPYAADLRAHFQTDAFTEAQIRGLRRGYLGCVTYVDRQLGRLLNALAANGILENTVVVYTSDHGEMLGKFGLWWKCSLYEDSVRVPLIVAGPGFRAGMRVTAPVELHDLQAAMFKAVCAVRPAGWRGAPLQDVPATDPNRVAFSEYHGHGTRSGAFMIRKGDWKLIYCMAAPHLLFNLAADPEELTSLAEMRRDKLRELEQDLRRICNQEQENRRAHAFEQQLVETLGVR